MTYFDGAITVKKFIVGVEVLTQDRLHELLSYNPDSGDWTWLVNRGSAKVGSLAGSPDTHGYLRIEIDGESYGAHRLAWFYVTGEWPRRIDHRDTVRSNNRWSNLRLATHRQNLANAKVSKRNALGVKGVTRSGSKKRPFRARIYLNARLVSLGCFATEAEANAAYFARAQLARGEFARG